MSTALGLMAIRGLLLLVAAALPVRVSTVDGEKVEGDFRGIENGAVVVETSSGKQAFKFDDLQSIAPVNPDTEAVGPKPRVTLVSGSKIAAQTISMAGDMLVVEPRRQPKLNIPLKDVKSIRFRAPSATTDPQWLGFLGQEQRGDMLAIRRSTGQIDSAPGVIEGIADGKVTFNMEGETVNAPMEKLEGVVLGGGRKINDSPDVQVVDRYGSRWAATSIQPSGKDGPLILQLSKKLTHSLPLDHVEGIFWSGGFKLLAAQSPADADFKPYLVTDANAKLLADWFKPKADGEDIVISGSGSIAYRVGENYSTLAGMVRRDSSVSKAGDVHIKVMVDDKEVWNETLSDPQPRGFELKVRGARRVRFVADSGSDGDVGDTVRILRPRLLK